ncbi:hypothetical protein [Dickeya ananatis]|uniref:hypothetical protein n=1 Tax=Dickeya ananatis TaxID=3061286 RepID=UPI00388D6266
MNPEEFIRKHVINTLIQEGYSQEQADKVGGVEAISYFRRSSKPSTKRRNIFDDCLDQARLIVRYGKKNKTKSIKGQMF